MRKLFMIILGILILISLIASSCSQNTSTSPTVPKTKAAPAASSSIPVTIPSSSESTQPQTGGTLKVILRGGSNMNLNVLGSPTDVGLSTQKTIDPVFERLLTTDINDNLQGTLAESFEVSKDGRSITLHLRKGIKFSDGTDFNAAAVQYNLENLLSNGVRPKELAAIISYDILDPYNLRLNLKEFNIGTLLSISTYNGCIASPTALQAKATPETMAKDHMVGTGPFLFSGWQRNNFVKFVRNPNYWQKGKPYLDGIEMNQVADPVTSLISFQKGEGQVLNGITPDEAKTLKAAGFDIISSDVQTTTSLFPDGANPKSPFANKLVRQALEYAIDKKALAANIGSGYYTVAQEYATPSSPYYISGLAPRDYNPQKAKELLTQANYPNGFKTSLIADTSANQDLLVAIQSYLKAVNIDVSIELTDTAKFNTIRFNGWNGILLFASAGTSRILFDKIGAGADYVSIYRPDWFKSEAASIVVQPDNGIRTSQIRKIVQTIYEEASIIHMWSCGELHAEAKSVQGLKWAGGGGPYYYEPANAWLK
jgi:peptide/nickel transport system substrate-binding protein